ncbi:MAG TPA: hypothetical protein VES67_25520 [Vicinamibacterales bacterium]|nr:hypothetical protein [Vicinamibacterales bacterium]
MFDWLIYGIPVSDWLIYAFVIVVSTWATVGAQPPLWRVRKSK